MKDNSPGFDLGIPQKGAKDGYLAMIYEMVLIGARIVAESKDLTDPRFKRYVPLFVAIHPDEKDRNDILNELEKAFDDAKDDRNDIRADKEHMACVRALGKTFDLTDRYIGITHTLRVGIAGDPDWLIDMTNKPESAEDDPDGDDDE